METSVITYVNKVMTSMNMDKVRRKELIIILTNADIKLSRLRL